MAERISELACGGCCGCCDVTPIAPARTPDPCRGAARLRISCGLHCRAAPIHACGGLARYARRSSSTWYFTYLPMSVARRLALPPVRVWARNCTELVVPYAVPAVAAQSAATASLVSPPLLPPSAFPSPFRSFLLHHNTTLPHAAQLGRGRFVYRRLAVSRALSEKNMRRRGLAASRRSRAHQRDEREKAMR